MQNSILRDRKGFTLIELLVVIAIIGILAMMTLPNFIQGQRRGSMQTKLAEIVTIFERARSQALASEIDSDSSVPPGGYGVIIDAKNSHAVLFVDDWNESDACEVNMNYAAEDISNRCAPDGKFTDGSDSIIKEFEINNPEYVSIGTLSGEAFDGTSWEDGDSVIVVFKPPYAEVTIEGIKNTASTDLKDFQTNFDLTVGANYPHDFYFNRVTTTPEIKKHYD